MARFRIQFVLAALLLISALTVPAIARAMPSTPTLLGQAQPSLQVYLQISTDTATPGQSVTFSYTAAALDDSSPLSAVRLDFGDGQSAQLPVASTGPTEGTFSHVYTEPQSYTATLSATADDGTTTATSLPLLVQAPSGSDQLSAGQPRIGLVGQPVDFTADGTTASPCGTIQDYQFNFGDDSPPASGRTVSHTYTAPGMYTILLTITDCAGLTATSLSNITIVPDTGVTH